MMQFPFVEGGNLYDDNYSASFEHDADPEPRGMEDSSWFYIISITLYDSYV